MRKIVTMILISLCALFSFADDANEKGEGKLYKGGGNITRPHKPSSEFISCEYFAGILFFDLPEYIEYVEVAIYDQYNCIVTSGSVSNSLPQYEVMLYPGVYRIECHCLDRGTFSGEMEIKKIN